jgi:hypothetical protein
VTGFVCDTRAAMVDAVRRIDLIDRGRCRARCERLFSDAAIVDAYERLYRDHVAKCAGAPLTLHAISPADVPR